MKNSFFNSFITADGILEVELIDRDGIVIEHFPESKTDHLGPRLANYANDLRTALAQIDDDNYRTMLLTLDDRTVVTVDGGSVLLTAITEPNANYGQLLALAGSLQTRLDSIGNYSRE